MQSKEIEALKKALTELCWYEEAGLGRISSCDAIHTIREVLAEQPAQHRHISYVCPQCHWSLEEQPSQQQEPETCANCKHNEWPFGMCDGCPKQSDESQTGNWEPEDKQPDYKALYEKAAQQYNDLAALMAQQQEPVAVVSGYYGGQCVILPTNPARIFNSGTALYTSPPASKPLTDEQIKGIYEDCDAPTGGEFTIAFTRAIEAAHGIKEKNT